MKTADYIMFGLAREAVAQRGPPHSPGPPGPPGIMTTTVFACPPGPPSFVTLASTVTTDWTATALEELTSTAYEPVPYTIYTTVVDTTILTEYSTAYQNITVYDTATTTLPPVTVTTSYETTTSETLYPIISEYTTTEVLTSLTLCPSRIAPNPTFTAQYPIPTEFTWGCPPGYLCKPAQIDCNFEVGLPDPGFFCSPDECIAADALGVPQLWDASPYDNVTAVGFAAIDSYFNMNPTQYGLTYAIFVKDEVFTVTETIGYGPTPAVVARQAETNIPSTCYPWCNNCLLEAQSVGKTPALCANGSIFEQDLTDCQECVAYHKSETAGTFVQISPQFQQFLDYCQSYSAPPPPPSTVTVTSTPPPATYTPIPESIFTTSTSLKIISGASATITLPATPLTSLPTSSPTYVTPSSSTSTAVAPVSTSSTHSSLATYSITEWLMTYGSMTLTFSTPPTAQSTVVVYGTGSTASSSPIYGSSSASTAVAPASTSSSSSSPAAVPASGTSSGTSTAATATFTGGATSAMDITGGCVAAAIFAPLAAVMFFA